MAFRTMVRRLALVVVTVMAVAALYEFRPSMAQFEQPAAHDEGASAIRLAIKQGLARFAQSIPEDVNLVLQGPVEVAVSGQQYAATLPALSLRAEEDGDDFELNLGPTTSTIDPLGANRLSAVIAPSEKLVARRNDEQVFSVDWVTRIAEATFNADYGFAEVLEIALDNVRATDAKTGLTVFDIAGVIIDGSYGAGTPGRVDGTGSLIANELRIMPPDGEDEVTVGQMAVDSAVSGFDLARYDAYVDFTTRLSGLNASQERLTVDQATAIADELVGFLDIFDAASQSLAFREFWVENEGGVGRASAGVSAQGLTGQTARFGLTGDIEGIDVPVEAAYDVFVPRRSQLKVGLAELPLPLVRETVRQVAIGVLTDAEDDEIQAALEGPLSDLMASEAVLEIDSAIVEFEDSAIFAEGVVSVDPVAAFGAVAQGNIRLVGFENLVEKSRNLPDGASIAAFLAILQAVGQEEEGADGMSVRRYEIEVTPDGSALLNGVDIGPLLEQMR